MVNVVFVLPCAPLRRSLISSHFFMGCARKEEPPPPPLIPEMGSEWMEWPTDDGGDWPVAIQSPEERGTTSLISLKVGQESSERGEERM